MAMHPGSNFPLLPSDQADVIRIYIDLMRERHRAEHPPEVATNLPFGPHSASDPRLLPGEMLDLD